MPLEPLENPSSLSARAAGAAKGVPAALFLFASLLAFNVLQTLSLLLLPFSRAAFRAFNRFAANTWWGWCVIGARALNSARIVLTGDDLPMRENSIVIANHQQMPDITFLMHLARDRDRLGDLKWFVKHAIKYVPGVGWGMVFIDCLFVHRNWADDAASIGRTFTRIVSGRVPLWLMSFPEGTRIRPHKLQAAQAYAAERGLEPPRHVLIPRTKGFVASVQGLRGHARSVLDVTIGYETGVPTLWQYVQGFSRVAHLHVRRFPVDSLPESPEALTQWLLDRFREKDRLLEHFYAHGSFPASAGA